MKILLIEDVSFSRKLIENQIQSHGHVVISTDSGYEALEYIKAEQFDLVVSDLFIPDLNGFQIFQECEKLPIFQSANRVAPPFVLLTSSSNHEDLKKAESMGFIAAMNKPLDMDRLDEIITSVGDGNAFLTACQARAKILLVDTVGRISRIMQEIMQGTGYSLLYASTEEDFSRCITEFSNIQLIISDLELKDTNAVTLLKHCQDIQAASLAEGKIKHMPPFILMTDSKNVDLLQIAFLSGFAEVILPPLDKNVVKQKINKIFLTEKVTKSSDSILVVDDVHFQCVLTKSFLKMNPNIVDKGYNILLSESGEGALEHLQTDSSIKLVILDYYMLELNGIEVYKQAKQAYEKSNALNGQNEKAPNAILLTFCEDRRIKQEALSQGFKYVFNKPIDPKTFNKAISEVLESLDKQNQTEQSS